MRGRKTRSRKRRHRQPVCQKVGKKRYGWNAAQKLSLKTKARFYWCSACRCFHRTTREPGIASERRKD